MPKSIDNNTSTINQIIVYSDSNFLENITINNGLNNKLLETENIKIIENVE